MSVCIYNQWLCIYIHISNFEYSRGREWQCISQRTDFGWHKSSDDSKYQRKIGKTACLKNHMPENLEMVQTYFFYWGLFPQWFLRTWWLSNGTAFNHPIQCQDSVVLLKAHQLTNHWRVPPFFRMDGWMDGWMHGWMHGWVGVSFLKKHTSKTPCLFSKGTCPTRF